MRHVLRNLVLVLCAASLAPLFADEPKPEAQEASECRHHRWHWHSRNPSEFAWQVQVDSPAKDLGRALDNRTGLGLGVQWNRYQGGGLSRRTRLEWNVFPEGGPVGAGALKTKASNYVLSLDHLYHFSGANRGPYLLAGLGGVRWFFDRTPEGGTRVSSHTTKLAVTGGAGYRFNPYVSAEARYLVSSVDRTYDGNVVQASVGMRF